MKKIEEYLSLLGIMLCSIGTVSLIAFPREKAMVEKVDTNEGNRIFSVELIELEEAVEPIVYDGMTLAELASKLDRSLNSTVSGQGYTFASYSLEKGVDPYLAVAIMLHETGCKWKCSNLVRSCNNVGGVKGSPSCGSGGYKRFTSLDEGIRQYIDNLSKNYISQGLNTPRLMERRYTGYSTGTWATKVERYMNEIRAK